MNAIAENAVEFGVIGAIVVVVALCVGLVGLLLRTIVTALISHMSDRLAHQDDRLDLHDERIGGTEFILEDHSQRLNILEGGP